MQIGAEGIDCVAVASERGGLYIHIAYCRKKCIYCDFFSAGDRIADWHGYVDALCSEFKERIKEIACPLRTVYIGGGTPSLMPEEEFLRLCDFIKPYIGDVEEFTLEVNPDDVNEHILRVWKKGGINRLSMGIQTFDDDTLRSIGRRHTSKEALEAYRLARNIFTNVSIDLMFGLPGQTIERWRNDLQTAISLHPEHISAYSLMYEEGTALTVLRDTGRLIEPSEDIVEQMFLLLIDELKRAGYDHYETSNFALPGYRSRHNSSYWLQQPYLGLGPSAHSYDGERIRKANRADLRGYIEYWTSPHSKEKGSIPFYEMERLSFGELIEEYVMTRMRMKEGIPLEDFRVRFGESAYAKLKANCNPLLERGALVSIGNNIFISEHEILISDSIIIDMLIDDFTNI
ncbi:MAG: radical SAM family heme chaperone HemW [Muribaculaceae bacterium]|nr:radical SAM family heme chaperone HemW [Muribaculaceae bacterium]